MLDGEALAALKRLLRAMEGVDSALKVRWAVKRALQGTPVVAKDLALLTLTGLLKDVRALKKGLPVRSVRSAKPVAVSAIEVLAAASAKLTPASVRHQVALRPVAALIPVPRTPETPEILALQHLNSPPLEDLFELSEAGLGAWGLEDPEEDSDDVFQAWESGEQQQTAMVG